MFYFLTGNKHKIQTAHAILDPLHLPFETENIDLNEIQSHSTEKIGRAKAEEAFSIMQKPIIVKDDSWYFTALNGFPGPYMRYMNEWLVEEDFLNLMKDKKNREIVYSEVLCYKDEKQTKVFINKKIGTLLTIADGTLNPFSRLVTLRKDHKTMARSFNDNELFFEGESAWEIFARWYIQEGLHR